MRKTKIIATLGPATDGPDVLAEMIAAGVDAVRLNFSHGTPAEHARRCRAAREAAEGAGRALAVIVDLQGPKLRTGRMRAGPALLENGQKFTITAEDIEGDKERVSCSYPKLPQELKPGDMILLDDGKIRLRVVKTGARDVITEVVSGGILSDHKSINLPGTSISLTSPTEKDLEDLRFAIREIEPDYAALSFVRGSAEIRRLKKAIDRENGRISVIAKIEKPEAIENIEEILAALDLGDGLMVARGDLGVECEIHRVPALQKRLLYRADEAGIVCITATQMLESMVRGPMPSRAEASDIFNAILDGTDAAMLSAETAVGDHPVEAVRQMAAIMAEAECWADGEPNRRARADFHDETFELAICRAACGAAVDADAKAVVALTRSGRTGVILSKVAMSSKIEIFAVTADLNTYRKMALYYGVRPILLPGGVEADRDVWDALDHALLDTGKLRGGDTVVIASGFQQERGATNVCKIVRLGRHEFY
jgi:pyruvate kinase